MQGARVGGNQSPYIGWGMRFNYCVARSLDTISNQWGFAAVEAALSQRRAQISSSQTYSFSDLEYFKMALVRWPELVRWSLMTQRRLQSICFSSEFQKNIVQSGMERLSGMAYGPLMPLYRSLELLLGALGLLIPQRLLQGCQKGKEGYSS